MSSIRKINFTDGFSTSTTPADTIIGASSFLVGTGVPSSGLGNDGDYYLDSNNGNMYIKASGSWSVDSVLSLPASNIVNTPAGNVAATDIQAAIDELDSEKLDKTGGTISGNLIVSGDLTVDGTTTTLNTAVLDVEDANVTINKGGTQATADSVNAGLTVEMSDATDALIGYDSSTTSKFVVGESGAEKEIATVSDIQSFTNKDIDGSTASDTSRITLPKESTSTLDTLTDKEATIAYDTTLKNIVFNDGTDWKEVGSGAGSGSKNYITNGKAEVSTDGWSLYKNTSASDLPDDFGGTVSGNLTFSRNITTPLSGAADFKLSTTAANLQGEGVYYEFTADRVDFATMLTGIVRKDSSDSGVDDGDYRYVLVSSSDAFVADFNIIRVNGEDLNGSDNDNLFQFQTDASDTSYRFCIHRTVTTATATNIYLDEMEIGPRSVIKSGAVSDWEDFTPTASTGYGTLAAATGKLRRVGDSLEVVCSITAGTVTTGDNFIYTPTGYVIDTNKVLGVDSNILGTAAIAGTAAGQYWGSTTGNAYFASQNGVYDNRIYLVTRTSASALWDYTQPVNSLVGNGSRVQLRYTVPILGWSSNSVSSEELGGRDILVYATGNDDEAITGDTEDIPFKTIVTDTTGSWSNGGNTGSNTNDQFTTPETGRYTVSGALASGSVGDSMKYAINGSNVVSISGTYTSTLKIFNFQVDLIKGDLLTIRMGTGATLTSSSSYISISKLASPQTILETATVAARYTSNSGQVIPDSTVTIIDFEDTILGFDTHNSVTTGASWKFSAPASGYYQVSAQVYTEDPDVDGGEEVHIRLHKNNTLFVRSRVDLPATPTNTRLALNLNTLVQLNKDEFIDIRVYFGAGASVTLGAGSEDNYISIVRMK